VRLISVLTAIAAALCLWAPVASADDSSVYGAWVSRDGDFAKLGRQYRKDAKLWVSSGHARQGPVLKVLARSRKLCATVNQAIGAESPSSADGKRGKAAAVASDNFLARAGRAEKRARKAFKAAGVQIKP
jgi:hypothetical protein